MIGDINPMRRKSSSREYRVSVPADNTKATAKVGLIVLAVRPQGSRQVMEDANDLAPRQLVLSAVAGASLSNLCEGLNHPCVVRAVPNLPAQIGEGMTVWTATPQTNQGQKELAQAALAALSI